jgi:hypothetical protein
MVSAKTNGASEQEEMELKWRYGAKTNGASEQEELSVTKMEQLEKLQAQKKAKKKWIKS